MPFWDDLYTPGGGTIYYDVQGTAPNRMFIVEWYDVPHISDDGTPRSHYTFEAILYETSNDIKFQYQSMLNGTESYADGREAVVGIENITGVVGAQYSCRETGAISDGLAILFYLCEDEPQPVGAVGGEVFPVNKVALLIPWIALALVIVAAGILLVRRRAFGSK